MTTQTLQIFRETSLPASLLPFSIYMIAPQGASDLAYVEMYVTDATGGAKRNVNRTDIGTMISNAIASANSLAIVSNIAARNALTPTRSEFVYVIDASGDVSVASGGATYLYNTGTTSWIKTSEAESLDVVTSWNSIAGKPTSSPAQIDSAVALSHGHSNKTQLDGIGQDAAGHLTYNGSLPATGWSSTAW